MDVQSKMIEVKTPAGAMPAQLAEPPGGPHPRSRAGGLGLNQHIKDVARRIAGEGYVTLAPDPFTVDRDEPRPRDLLRLSMMGELTDDGSWRTSARPSHLEHLATVSTDRINIRASAWRTGQPSRRVRLPANPGSGPRSTAVASRSSAPPRSKGSGAGVLRRGRSLHPLDRVRPWRRAKRLGKSIQGTSTEGAARLFCNERDRTARTRRRMRGSVSRVSRRAPEELTPCASFWSAGGVRRAGAAGLEANGHRGRRPCPPDRGDGRSREGGGPRPQSAVHQFPSLKTAEGGRALACRGRSRGARLRHADRASRYCSSRRGRPSASTRRCCRSIAVAARSVAADPRRGCWA
jgi:hypothetical protein